MRKLDQVAVEAACKAYWSGPPKGAISAAIRAYLDATAPSRAPTREITMQDVRLIAGEGKLDAATVLDAVNAHLRREDGRAPDGGVTELEIEAALETVTAVREMTKQATGGNCAFVDDDVRLLARLAASHAGDRELILLGAREDAKRVCRLHSDVVTVSDDVPLSALRRVRNALMVALAPAAGQDDAGEVERG